VRSLLKRDAPDLARRTIRFDRPAIAALSRTPWYGAHKASPAQHLPLHCCIGRTLGKAHLAAEDRSGTLRAPVEMAEIWAVAVS
jgi:hypothetical protein